MPASYTIEQLGQKAVWENDANKGDYPAILSGVEGEVLVFHDSSSDYDPPKIGDELFGEVMQDKRGRARFRRGSKGSAPGGHRPRGGSRDGEGPGLTWRSAPFERGAEHPRNEARVIHTSALSAAPGYINQAIAFGVMDAPKDEDAYWKLVGKVATKLVRSYERALEPLSQPQLQQEVPADTSDFPPPPARSDESVPF